ncbi:hypothetical protein [Streptomyces sp. NPDC053720]|uniref:hypothetical protein n=1 Tax=Streptomyces sp. NPDC053720 TaxID=3154855 RepID=UPI0034413D34
MTNWTPTTLVTVDEVTDRDRASDGYSRYGAYIADRTKEKFQEYDGTTLSAAEFAAAAWETATPPVLIGYVLLRPDVKAITTYYTENSELVVKVTIPLWHHDLPADRRPGYPWQDWEANIEYGARDTKYVGSYEPDVKEGRPAVLTETHLLIPAAGWDLPTPQHTSGRGLVEEAKAAVHEIVRGINEHAAPMVAKLLADK